MLLAMFVYTTGAAIFYTLLVRSSVVCEEPWAATHPVAPVAEIIEIYPARDERKAA